MRTVKLFGPNGHLFKEIELPKGLLRPPTVIFYGMRAFHSLLVGRGDYHECSCWRAPEVEAESREHLGEAG